MIKTIVSSLAGIVVLTSSVLASPNIKLNCDLKCRYWVESTKTHLSKDCGSFSEIASESMSGQSFAMTDGIKLEFATGLARKSKNFVEIGLVYSNTASTHRDGSVLTVLPKGRDFSISIPIRDGVTQSLSEGTGTLMSIAVECSAK